MKVNGNQIRTFTGLWVDPFNMRPEDLSMMDIAHSLSLICRYNGHCHTLYSVAEHSVRVVDLLSSDSPRTTKLWGLLHDASEAYVGDIAGPLKHRAAFRELRLAEADILLLIAKKWHLPWPIPPEVHEADRKALAEEMNFLWGPAPEQPAIRSLMVARDAFIEKLSRLTEGMNE